MPTPSIGTCTGPGARAGRAGLMTIRGIPGPPPLSLHRVPPLLPPLAPHPALPALILPVTPPALHRRAHHLPLPSLPLISTPLPAPWKTRNHQQRAQITKVPYVPHTCVCMILYSSTEPKTHDRGMFLLLLHLLLSVRSPPWKSRSQNQQIREEMTTRSRKIWEWRFKTGGRAGMRRRLLWKSNSRS